MTAMTPMRAVRVVGLSVFIVDYANHADLVASCPDHDRALWVGSSLAKYHRSALETADHGLEAPEVVWSPDRTGEPGSWATSRVSGDWRPQAGDWRPQNMPIEAVPSSRADIIQEAADRLNDWLADTRGYQNDRDSIISTLRSYAAE